MKSIWIIEFNQIYLFIWTNNNKMNVSGLWMWHNVGVEQFYVLLEMKIV